MPIKCAFGFFLRRIRETAERFPLPVICIVAFNIIAEFDLELRFNPPLLYGGCTLVFLLLYCGVFWFISVRLCSEAHGLSLSACYAIGLVIFLPALYLTAVTQAVKDDGLAFALPALFVSMFVAPFIRRNATRKEMWRFYSDFWSHIGRAIPVVILLYVIGGGILYGLYYFFDAPFGRKQGGMLTGIILFLYLPLTALTGIPKIRRKFTQTK